MTTTVSSDLRHLKKFLQRGEMGELCEDVGISRSQGANVISGKSKNWLFVEKLLARVEANKALLDKANTI